VPSDPLGLVDHTLLGRYYVEAPIAQGGMGAVYRGSDLRLRRPVCIKIFHRLCSSELLHQVSYDHFVQEAFALSRLSHPNTLRIYDFGRLTDDSEAPFQVFELLDGGTLGQWIRQAGPRSPRETFALVEPVAGALSEAHARGIIHRDVKPSNIILCLLGSRRVAKLGDFGIAETGGEQWPSRARRQHAAVQPAPRLYSSGWAAPEQLEGGPAAPTTDVFALGLVTAFVLGGQPVFAVKGDRLGTRERLLSDAHVTRRLAEMQLAPELAEVVLTACRACPDERYGSMEQFASALGEAVDAAVKRLGSDRTVASVAGTWGEPRSGMSSSPLLLPADDVELPPAELPPSGDVRARRTQSAAPAALAPYTRVRAARGTGEVKLVVDCAAEREITVLGRRLVLAGVAFAGQLDLGGAGAPLTSRARVRVTLLPARQPGARINVKGLNCFVAKADGRPAAAIDVEENAVLELLGEDRLLLDRVVCSLGRARGTEQLCRFGPLTLCVTGAEAGAALLDVGPGRELVLIHRGMPVLRQGGSA
jgi:serine/threonine-protein kinase